MNPDSRVKLIKQKKSKVLRIPPLVQSSAVENKLVYSDSVIVLRVFNNEIDAGMAQQVLQEGGITAFVFKDDAGGMEPQLQRSAGVRLVINRADEQRARQMLRT